MHRLVFIIACLASSLVLAEEDNDGPFGIYMGMPIEELESYEDRERNDWAKDLYEPSSKRYYALSSVPVPNPIFQEYAVLMTDSRNVCGVIAYLDDARTEDEERLVKEISEKYGSEPYQKKIYDSHHSAWVFEDGVDNIKSITISSWTDGRATKGFQLAYIFQNFGECEEALVAGK